MIVNKGALSRVIAAFLTIFLATFLLHQNRITSSAPDFDCASKGTSEILIEIPNGAAGSTIAEILFQKQVIKSARSFFSIAVGDQRAATISPGTHRIEGGICAKEALAQLLDSKRILGLIKIAEGSWNSEIFKSMESTGFSKSEIRKAVANLTLPQGFKKLEGLLFPAQYSFAAGTSANDAINSMLARATGELEKSGILTATGKYTPQQILIMASIAQAEGNEEDFSKVIRVILNRLKIGMPLQMDSTVHYIKGDRGKIFLSTKSTYLSSPYNTYRNYGLPPGPIGNPGRAALIAAANPSVGDWLYFVTVAPSDTRFTSSVQEFAKWKVEYKKNLRAGLFRSEK